MIIADTSGLLALYNDQEPAHKAVAEAITASNDPLVISPYVIAELDYLLATRMGVSIELKVLEELSSGAYDLALFSADDLRNAAMVIERYKDLGIGIADASLVVLAHRYRTRTMLSLDRRHFSVVRPIDGGVFKLLPG